MKEEVEVKNLYEKWNIKKQDLNFSERTKKFISRRVIFGGVQWV